MHKYKNYKLTIALIYIGIGIFTLNCGSDSIVETFKEEINTRKIDFSSIKEQDRRLNYEGLDYFRRKNYALALDKFKAAQVVDKKNAEYFNNAGICLLRMKDSKAAESQFNQAIKLRELGLYYNNLSLALINLSKFQAAKVALEKAAELDPQDTSAWSQLGKLYAREKKFKKARTVWKKAAHLKNNGELENNLGISYLQEGRNRLARVHFKKAVKLNPAYALGHFNLGVVYQNESNYKEAIKSYETALKLQPAGFQAYLNLGIVYQKLDQKQAAVRNLENFLKYCPPHLKTQISHARERLSTLNQG